MRSACPVRRARRAARHASVGRPRRHAASRGPRALCRSRARRPRPCLRRVPCAHLPGGAPTVPTCPTARPHHSVVRVSEPVSTRAGLRNAPVRRPDVPARTARNPVSGTRGGPCGARRGSGTAGRGEHGGGVAQHLRLRGPQFGTGRHTELGIEADPDPLPDVERLRPLAGGRQGTHEPGLELFVERVLARRAVQHREQAVRAAARQSRVGRLFDGCQVLTLQRGEHQVVPGLQRDSGGHRPRPQCQRLQEQGQGRLRRHCPAVHARSTANR